MPAGSRPQGAGGFVPIHPNPYIVGNPVRGTAMFFGREFEFDLVRKRLTAAGGLFVFSGERRSGKTSILFQILDHRLGTVFLPVLIDMQSMAISNEADFLGKICDEILETLGPEAATIERPDFAAAKHATAEFQSFIENVLRRHPDKKLVLLFDEYELFENKIDSGILGEEVLHILASLMEKKEVFLVFTGSQNIDQRRRSYWGILSKASTFKEISYLEREDALNLIQQPVAGQVHYEPDAVQSILRLTAGQPFYTQAICRDVVDWLNEHQTNTVTVDMIAGVVDRLVRNPLPQMNFHWQSLSRDEKVVLALLAETLPDERAFASSEAIVRRLSQGKYPPVVDKPRVEIALEKLFAAHLLAKNEQRPLGWAFQMDLWRRWIQRMHSLWQVVREEGIDLSTYRRRARRRRIAIAAGVAAGVVAAVLAAREAFRPPGAPSRGRSVAAMRGLVEIQARPAGTRIFRDNQIRGVDSCIDSVTVATATYLLSAPGFVDTSFTLAVDEGSRQTVVVELRPQTGVLVVDTAPQRADVRIEGTLRGKSPLVLAGLRAGVPLALRIESPGRAPRDTSVVVGASDTSRVLVRLIVQEVDVYVSVSPPQGRVFAGGVAVEGGSIRLPVGAHQFAARLAGHADWRQSIDVAPGMAPVAIVLRPLPDGAILVKGSKAAVIQVNGQQIGPGPVFNSQDVRLRPGLARVHIDVKGAPILEDSIMVRPDTLATYDFDTRTVTYARKPVPPAGS